MKFSSFFSLCGVFGSALLLSSCASDESHYYSLVPVAGGGVQTASNAFDAENIHIIEVRTPSIVARLDRDSIVKGSKNYRLNIEKDAAWASPPAEMVGHILVEDLMQRMPGKIIFAQNDSVTVSPQLYIELSLTHFELDQSGYAVIEGILSLHKVGAKAEDARAIPVQWASSHIVKGGMAGFVAALSEGIGVISDQTVSLLRF